MGTAGSRRVLIADDSVDSSEPLAVLLTMDGCDVRTCDRGCDLLPTAAAFRPHLILLDLVFHEGMSGIELLGQLRQHETTARTVIAILSGRTDERMQAAAQQAGADFYFMKPADPARILEFVMRIDRRSPDSSPDTIQADRRTGEPSTPAFIRSRVGRAGFSAANALQHFSTSVAPRQAEPEWVRASSTRPSHHPS